MDPESNVCCPIKLLLIWALRVGAVPQTSWDELLANLRATKSHSVCWTRPDYPVFCAMHRGKGYKFRYDAPAGIAVGTRALARGAALIGLSGRVTSHDIRRGAARELAGLDTAATGTNVEAARVGLGHSRKTMVEGVTDEYIGGARVDTWGLRLSSDTSSSHELKHKLDFADTPYQKPKRRSAQEITQACGRYGLDPKIVNARVTAGRKLEQEHFQAWLAEQEAARKEAPSRPTTAPEYMMHSGQSTASTEGRLAEPDCEDTEQEAAQNEAPSRPISAPEYMMHPGQSTASTEGRLAEADLEGDIPIDPALGNLQSLLFGEPSEAQEAILWETGLAPGHSIEMPDSCKVISADRETFITFFSQINVTFAQMPGFNSRDHMPSMSGDTSRSEPSRYKWLCANERFGCEQSFETAHSATRHHGSCTLNSPEAYQSHLLDLELRVWKCDECPKSFKTRKDLLGHTQVGHFKPRKCTKAGCTSQEVFRTRYAWKQHETIAHTEWSPRGCPVADCRKADHKYLSKLTLNRHLKEKHGFLKENLI